MDSDELEKSLRLVVPKWKSLQLLRPTCSFSFPLGRPYLLSCRYVHTTHTRVCVSLERILLT